MGKKGLEFSPEDPTKSPGNRDIFSISRMLAVSLL
jgi:hypothetical protein